MKRSLIVLIALSGTAAPVCVERSLHGWVHAGTESPMRSTALCLTGISR